MPHCCSRPRDGKLVRDQPGPPSTMQKGIAIFAPLWFMAGRIVATARDALRMRAPNTRIPERRAVGAIMSKRG